MNKTSVQANGLNGIYKASPRSSLFELAAHASKLIKSGSAHFRSLFLTKYLHLSNIPMPSAQYLKPLKYESYILL